MYNWQLPNWPDFSYDEARLSSLLDRYENLVLPLIEKTRQLPQEDRFDFTVEILVAEATNTSSIEGEYFQPDELKSSIINNISEGLAGRASRSQRARGVSELVTLVRKNFDLPLSLTTLKYWHEVLLGFDNRLRVVGDFRKGPEATQIVGGSFQRRIVYFEAPPAETVPAEMDKFIGWINSPWSSEKLIIKEGAVRAGLAHMYFESIHPFEDGNGRIGRFISDKLLAITLGFPAPFSISRAIQNRQKNYYAALNQGQKGMEVTSWLIFFLEILIESIDDVTAIIGVTLKKNSYFNKLKGQLEERHKKALLEMWAAEPQGFQGGMTARKYLSITRASRATAARDFEDLVAIGALERRGAGRSTHYVLPGAQ